MHHDACMHIALLIAMQSWSWDNDAAGLRVEELEELETMSLFPREQIQRLYRRFQTLDRQGTGALTEEDLLRVPEVALNPMVGRVMALFGLGGGKTSIHFVDFVRALSVFNGRRGEDEILETCFEAFADKGAGVISREGFAAMVKTMVGDKGMTPEEVDRLVARAMDEIRGEDPRGITLQDFCRVLKGNPTVEASLRKIQANDSAVAHKRSSGANNPGGSSSSSGSNSRR